MADDLATYFSGSRLYGDDFSREQIREWFADEAEGYARLGSGDRASYRYAYHQLNRRHAFDQLAGRRFDHALGIGSAYGDEFQPIARQIRRITILDPSDAFASVNEIHGTPCSYRKPDPLGDIAFATGTFDLALSLGALHHIPNVSHVVAECHRCLRDGGLLLLREPIVSMGDWRRPRPGLTPRERGIPLPRLDEIIRKTGFTVARRSLCVFPLVPRLAGMLRRSAYDDPLLTSLDAWLSRAFGWNVSYHRTRLYRKLAPTSAYYVLVK